MKSLVDLWLELLLDCGSRCDVRTERDGTTVLARVGHEGESFLTITLPTFCKDFERGLEEGRLGPHLFSSFGKRQACLPHFMWGFMSKVFDRQGNLMAEPSIDCIRAIRQLCLFAKKILRPCSSNRARDAIEKFCQCDNDVVTPTPSVQLFRYFVKVARVINASLDLNKANVNTLVRPTHGPGATQEGISGNQKWIFQRWHRRLEDVGFTYIRYGRTSSEVTPYDLDVWPDIVEPRDEAPVKVVTVPKTLSTPRIIAVEPVNMQFIQQGLSRYLVAQLERSWLTAGHVNFRDQSVNQGLALRCSEDGLLATLDMSEASDRVSMGHVDAAFEAFPDFLEMLRACRSTRARLPDGRQIDLRKFASMGSALCFPVEAMVFFISIIAIRCLRAGVFPSARNVYTLSRHVYVYGDDLIVPADEASAICDDLESIGFKVNRRKSFWNGKFRESCGSDCYDGVNVTPVYVRRDLPTDRGDISGLLSAVSTANQLEIAGYRRTAAAMREAVEARFGPLPRISLTLAIELDEVVGNPRLASAKSPVIGWYGHSTFVPASRWNKHLQREEFRCWVAVSPVQNDPLEGDAALTKCLRLIGVKQVDPRHLDVSPRPYSL